MALNLFLCINYLRPFRNFEGNPQPDAIIYFKEFTHIFNMEPVNSTEQRPHVSQILKIILFNVWLLSKKGQRLLTFMKT